MLESGPVTNPYGPPKGVGTANSVKAPAVVTRPTLSALYSPNQRLPSGPVVMSTGPDAGVGVRYSWSMVPSVLITPILLSVPFWVGLLGPYSANQRLPSGPVVMPM